MHYEGFYTVTVSADRGTATSDGATSSADEPWEAKAGNLRIYEGESIIRDLWGSNTGCSGDACCDLTINDILVRTQVAASCTDSVTCGCETSPCQPDVVTATLTFKPLPVVDAGPHQLAEELADPIPLTSASATGGT